MSVRSIRRQSTNPGAYPATPDTAPIYVDSDDNILKIIPAGSGTTEVQVVDVSSAQTITNKTLTAPVISSAATTDLTETVAATNVLTAAETGKVCFLSAATEFVSTLPAPAAGLHFTFIVAAAPSGASYTVVTNGSANVIVGNIVESADAGGNGDSEASGGDTVSFVDGTAVVGDKADFYCDGTNWYVYGQCAAHGGITITTAS